jgi:hypothetical protein
VRKIKDLTAITSPGSLRAYFRVDSGVCPQSPQNLKRECQSSYRTHIRTRVKRQMEKSQREYFLSEQMKAIQKEMGEEEGRDEVAEIDGTTTLMDRDG